MLRKLFNEKNINYINKIITITFFLLMFPVFILIPENFSIGHYSLKTTYISLCCIIIGCLLLFFNIRKFSKIRISFIGILIFVYAILILLSTLNSSYIRESLWGTPQGRGEGIFTLYIYLLAFYISYKTYVQNNTVDNITTCAVLIIACVGVLQATIGRYFGFGFKYCLDGEYMAYGTMINPNFFSTFITIFLPAYIIKYISEEDNHNLCTVGIIFAGLVCSKSLGGYITFLIYTTVIIIYFFIIKKEKKKIIQKTLILFMLFITIFILLNSVNDNKYMEEFNFVFKETENASNNSKEFANNRGYIWSICIEILKEHPIFGVGPDSMGREVVCNYMERNDYIFGGLVVDKAHNEYLHIAVTLGIPAAIVYMIFLLITIGKLLIMFIHYMKNKLLDSKQAVFIVSISAIILSYMVQAVVNISVTCVAPMFWIILGIANKKYDEFKRIHE